MTLVDHRDESAAVRGARWVTVAFLVVGVLNYLYALVLTHLLNVADYSTFAAGQGLRVTDVLRRDEDGIRVLFTGCDEMTAARALERVPVPPAKLYLASTVQVLCASGEGGLE